MGLSVALTGPSALGFAYLQFLHRMQITTHDWIYTFRPYHVQQKALK